MRWQRGYRSDDVEDRRGEAPLSGGGGGGGFSGGAGLLGLLFSRFGFPGLIVGAVVLYFSGAFSGSGSSAPAADGGGARAVSPDQDTTVQFVSFVFDDVQSSWQKTLATTGAATGGPAYRHAKLVLFRDATKSGCGLGESAMGPFYCPQDERVYIDLAFYDELRQRFGSPGDFAQAYVIAHEMGHHIQHLLGIDAKLSRAAGGQQTGATGASVRFELQADCLAGVWAKSTEQRKLLEEGDIDEALKAASAIGDDQLQKQAGGRVQPETWTHGSSAERVRWFKRGYTEGTVNGCQTFDTNDL